MENKSTYEILVELETLLARHSLKLQHINSPEFNNHDEIGRTYAELLIEIRKWDFKELLSTLTKDPQSVKLLPRLLTTYNLSRLSSIIDLSQPTENEMPTKNEMPAYHNSRVLVKKWFYKDGDERSGFDIEPRFFKNWYHDETKRLARLWVELQDYYHLLTGSTPIPTDNTPTPSPSSLITPKENPKLKRTRERRFSLGINNKENLRARLYDLHDTLIKKLLIDDKTSIQQVFFWFGLGDEEQNPINWIGGDLGEFKFFIEQIPSFSYGSLKLAIEAFSNNGEDFNYGSLRNTTSKKTERIIIVKNCFSPNSLS